MLGEVNWFLSSSGSKDILGHVGGEHNPEELQIGEAFAGWRSSAEVVDVSLDCRRSLAAAGVWGLGLGHSSGGSGGLFCWTVCEVGAC